MNEFYIELKNGEYKPNCTFLQTTVASYTAKLTQEYVSVEEAINPHCTARTPVHPVIDITGTIVTGYCHHETNLNTATASSLAAQPIIVVTSAVTNEFTGCVTGRNSV